MVDRFEVRVKSDPILRERFLLLEQKERLLGRFAHFEYAPRTHARTYTHYLQTQKSPQLSKAFADVGEMTDARELAVDRNLSG